MPAALPEDDIRGCQGPRAGPLPAGGPPAAALPHLQQQSPLGQLLLLGLLQILRVGALYYLHRILEPRRLLQRLICWPFKNVPMCCSVHPALTTSAPGTTQILRVCASHCICTQFWNPAASCSSLFSGRTKCAHALVFVVCPGLTFAPGTTQNIHGVWPFQAAPSFGTQALAAAPIYLAFQSLCICWSVLGPLILGLLQLLRVCNF